MKLITLLSVAFALLATPHSSEAASARPFKGRYEAYVTLRTLTGAHQDIKIVDLKINGSGRVRGFILEMSAVTGGFAPSAKLKGKVTGIRDEYASKPVHGIHRWVGRLNLRAPAGLRFKLTLTAASPTTVLIEGTARQGAYSADVDFKTF